MTPAGAQADARRRHPGRLEQTGQRLAAAAAYRLFRDVVRGLVLLHHEPAPIGRARGRRIGRLLGVEVDGERVLGHVGIVDPMATHALALEPRRPLFEVLTQPVREHLRARGRGERRIDPRSELRTVAAARPQVADG